MGSPATTEQSLPDVFVARQPIFDRHSNLFGYELLFRSSRENRFTATDQEPAELSVIANVMVAPPMPFVPADHHGKLIVMATLAYAGPTEAGERAVAPFRTLATPLADMVRPMRYPELYPPEQPGFHPVATGRSLFVDAIDRRAAETIVDRLQESTAFMAAAQLRVLGGAMARVPAGATAFAHRERRIMANVAAVYLRPEETPVHEPWVTGFAAALRQDAPNAPGAYVNFLGDEGAARVREAYPGSTWDRLAAIKARYDPTNLFRLNQNIPPVSERQGKQQQIDGNAR